jgi:hypothetical protein
MPYTSDHRNVINKLRDYRELRVRQENEVAKYNKKLRELSRRRRTVLHDKEITECKLRKACIDNRCRLQIAAANAEYQAGRREMGDQHATEPLKVFCVSAVAFSLLVKGETEKALRKGFRTKLETGIPDLRDALIATTWGLRERKARAFIEDVASSFTRLQGWCEDPYSDYRMQQIDRALLQSKIDQHFATLDTVCSVLKKCLFTNKMSQTFQNIHLTTVSNVQRLLQTGLLAKLPGFSNRAASKTQRMVTFDWVQKPILWSTHRAINKKAARGHKHTSRPAFGPSRIYDWNADL